MDQHKHNGNQHHQPEEYAAESPQQRVDVRQPYLSVAQAIGLMILLVVLQMFISAVLDRIGGRIADQNSWLNLSITHFTAGMLTAIAGAILAGLSVTALLFSGFNPGLLFPLLSAMLGVSILSSELNNVLQWISPVSRLYIETLQKLFEQNIWGVLLAVGVVAPVVEELIFRGVLLDGLRRRYSTAASILVSSVLFGLVHIFPWVMINAFLLGIFFCWLKLHTGSLVICILSHSIYNSLPFILTGAASVVIPGFNSEPVEENIQFQPLWFDLVGIGLLAGGVWGIRNIMTEEREAVDRYVENVS